MFFLAAGCLVLLLDDLCEGADVDVRDLGDGQVDEGLRVDDFHGVFFNQFELHDHDVVFYVFQV